jgi:hypothetical protein
MEVLDSLVVPSADSLVCCKAVEMVTSTEILAETAVDAGNIVVSVRTI